MTTIKDYLKGKIGKKELELVPSSFEVVGDIAIIEIPAELEKKEGLIGEALLSLNKNVKVVCKKAGLHTGIFRRQKLKIIAGERRKTTVYKENNALIKLHVQDVYFSARLATERKRIAELVKQNEEVLVMFSGCAPYVAVIAKNTKAKLVWGIEINPIAHKFGLENVKLNKLNNVKLFLGDARLVAPALRKKFDRILMPLPIGGENFIDVALSLIKKGGTIHYYDFKDESGFHISEEKVKSECKKAGKKCKILLVRKCGQVGKRNYRVCVDFKAE
jgi:tRNA (guanine37-N1)-methyltransferase